MKFRVLVSKALVIKSHNVYKLIQYSIHNRTQFITNNYIRLQRNILLEIILTIKILK